MRNQFWRIASVCTLALIFGCGPSNQDGFSEDSTPESVQQEEGTVQTMAVTTPYEIIVSGPKNVVRGHMLPINLVVKPGTQASEGVDVLVTGLPAGSSIDYTDLRKTCCVSSGGGYYIYSIPAAVGLSLNTGTTTPTGNVSLYIRITGRTSHKTQVATYMIAVQTAPSQLAKLAYTAAPALSYLAGYNSNMIKYGTKHCNADTIATNGMWDGSVQYYDGERVFYQIAAYTGVATWKTNCAQYVEEVYRDTYVFPNQGKAAGYKVFPHGMLADYRATADARSRDGVLMLAAAGWKNSPLNYKIKPTAIREVAYLINSLMAAQNIQPSLYAAELKEAVDLGLGQLDQMFVSKSTTYTQPFMVALMSEALIRYYERTNDSRIPLAIQTAMNNVWNMHWNPATESFYYLYGDGSPGDGTPGPRSNDLNGLIVPIYGWLYLKTGNPIHRTRGDQIFNGMRSAWLDNGKQFSQSYRLSMTYLKWRQGLNVTVDYPLGPAR